MSPGDLITISGVRYRVIASYPVRGYGKKGPYEYIATCVERIK